MTIAKPEIYHHSCTKLFVLFYLVFLFQPTFSQESYIRVQNKEIKLYYEDAGSGRTLLFIPGWTMTASFFQKQQAYFQENYRVITYDPRSQGKSDKTQKGNTYVQHAQDLQDMILSLDVSEVTLIGWSSGCLTIFAYLEAFGTDRISKLVCIDEPPKWIGDRDTEWVYGTFDGYRSSLRGLLKERNPNSIIEWMLAEPLDSTTKNWMRAEMLQTPDHAALSLYIDGMISDYNEVLMKLGPETPILFALREDWHDQGAAWLNKHVPAAETAAISSHAMFWEQPDKFNDMLEKFLRK